MFVPLVSTSIAPQTDSIEPSAPVVSFELKQGRTYAKGQRTSDGFVLLKGSRIRTQLSPSCPKHAKKAREQYAHLVSADGVLFEDVLLRSPAEAACFVTGTSINAREAWKTADGKTLKEIETSE